jgi:hypothetical protein
MSHTGWVDPRIEQVTVAGIRAYLLQRGWTPEPFPGPELLVFAGPLDDDGEPMIQVVPSDETYVDYRLRVEELIGALSVLEDRYAVDVLNDILQAGAATPTPTNGAATGATPSPTTGR